MRVSFGVNEMVINPSTLIICLDRWCAQHIRGLDRRQGHEAWVVGEGDRGFYRVKIKDISSQIDDCQ